jgi:hypothetical protein
MSYYILTDKDTGNPKMVKVSKKRYLEEIRKTTQAQKEEEEYMKKETPLDKILKNRCPCCGGEV